MARNRKRVRTHCIFTTSNAVPPSRMRSRSGNALLQSGHGRGRALPANPPSWRTSAGPLATTEVARARGLSLESDVLGHLQRWYGTEAREVIEFSAAQGLLDPLTPAAPVIAGEVAYAVDRAQAVRLSDVVLRRTPLGSAGHPGRDALDRASAIMGARLGWDDARRAEEMLLVERTYPS